MGVDRSDLDRLAEYFSVAPVAVLTGAGISTDSGIPDYRGKGSPPRRPMNIDEFMGDEAYRRRFWGGARIGAIRASGIEPNAGHRALAQLETDGRIQGVITQNVDNLHRRAGSQNVAELHGNGDVIRCVPTGHLWSREQVLQWFDEMNPGFVERQGDAEIGPDGDAIITDIDGIQVPVCPICGSTLRPDVVYFGEYVPGQVFAAAEQLVTAASAFLIAGTSLAVNTGVRLVHRAERRGIPVIVVNRGPTAIDDRESVKLRIDAGTTETLIALLGRLNAPG